MATEQVSTVASRSGSFAKWLSWLAALVGLWALVSPFVLSGPIGSGTAMWSAVASGAAIAVLAAYGAYSIRTAAETAANSAGEWSGWLAGVAGLWLVASPFVLSGAVTAGAPMWSTAIAGAAALVLAAYAGYALHAGA